MRLRLLPAVPFACMVALFLLTSAVRAARANETAHGRVTAGLEAPLTAGSSSPLDATARSSFLDAPPPPPPPLPPAPGRDGEDYPRRAWEAFPFAAVSAPFCHGAAMGTGRCGETAAGPGFGGGVLYRVSPHFAVGAQGAWFQFRPGSDNVAFTRASWLGLLVRGYFFDRGAIEPYVETGLGRGATAAGTVDGSIAFRTEAAGPSVMAGAGIDFWVLPCLRVGPTFSYRWTWLTDVRSCEGGTCQPVSLAERGVVGSHATLSLLATVALGQEM